MNRNEQKSVVFEPSGKRVGDYLLGQLLGVGGMGSVYLARQISMKRLVALKILHLDLALDEISLKRFFREMRLSANLRTDGVAQVYEAGRDGDIVYFSMEYVEGNNLNILLRLQRHPFSEDETLAIALFVAETMSYAWKQYKIVHRDIKPANIVQTVGGKYKLLDLGVSKSFGKNDVFSTNITSSKFMVGSPAYMSPEQAKDSNLDCRADIYSLGITMFQLITGKLPYESPSHFEVVAMHFKSPVPEVRDARADVSLLTSKLIHNMLAKHPDDRPENWDVLCQQIRKIIARRKFLKRFSFLQDKKFRVRAAFVGIVALCAATIVLFTGNDNNAAPQSDNTAVPVETKAAAPAAKTEVLSQEQIVKLREEVLRTLLQQSGKYERNKDFHSALALWRHYEPPKSLQNDRILRIRIEDQIRFLQEQIRKQNEAESELTAE